MPGAANMSEEDWASAIARVRGGEAVRAVARSYGVSHMSLARRNKNNDVEVTSFGPAPHLTLKGEDMFVKWLQHCESIGQTVEVKAAWDTARGIAKTLDIPGFAGERAWLDSFLRRHPDVVRRTGELRIAKCAATVAAKAAAKEARLARQAEKAAGVKRKRTSAPEAAPVLVGVQRPAGVVEGSPSAAGKRKRGVSRVRVGVVALPAAKRRKVARIEISR